MQASEFLFCPLFAVNAKCIHMQKFLLELYENTHIHTHTFIHMYVFGLCLNKETRI